MRYTLDDFGIVNGSEFMNNEDYRCKVEQLVSDMMGHFKISSQALELTLDEYSITARGIDDNLYYFKVFTPAAYSDNKLIQLFMNRIRNISEKNTAIEWEIDHDGVSAHVSNVDPVSGILYYPDSAYIEMSNLNGDEVMIDFEKVNKCEVTFDGFDEFYEFIYPSGMKVTITILNP